MTNQFLQAIFPGFSAGLQSLHNVLIGPAALICIAGMYLRLLKAGASTNEVYDVLVRVGLVVVVISQVYTIGDILVQLATDLVTATGWKIDQNMWQDYTVAVMTKYNPVTQPGNNNPLQFFSNAFQGAWIGAWATFVYGFSIFASGLMMLSRLLQSILINVEMGLSPLFLAAIVVPSLVTLATRWGTTFIALCMWTVGFAIADLGTKGFMDLAVNPGNNAVLGAANAVGASTMLWVFMGLWICFVSVMGPILIWKAIVSNGSHGLHMIPMAMMGAVFAGTAMAKGAIGNVAAGGNAAVTLSSPPASRNGVVRPGFANSRP
jgi:hypothetical protein